MLTLQEFKKTGTRHSVSDACDLIGIDPDYFADSDVVAVWVFDQTTHITETATGFAVMLGRDEYTGTRDDMESALYFEWYVSECQDEPHTLIGLTVMLEEFATAYALDLQSADEMVLHVTGPKRTFLEWFLSEWDSAENRVDDQKYGFWA